MLLVLLLGCPEWLQTTALSCGAEWLQVVHEALVNVSIAGVALHALAALLMGQPERTSPVGAMVAGVTVFK